MISAFDNWFHSFISVIEYSMVNHGEMCEAKVLQRSNKIVKNGLQFEESHKTEYYQNRTVFWP